MKRPCFLLLLIAILSPHVGCAGSLVVIVNPASGVRALTRNEVMDVFLGRFRKLPTGIAALPIDLDPESAERQQFYLRVARKDPQDMSSYWARLVLSGQSTPPFQVADERSALELVARNPNAIAYVNRRIADNRVRIVLELEF